MFIGREKELEYLSSYYQQSGIRMLVIYGQRGMGKTKLLQHFLEGKEHFYYEAVSCSTRQQKMFMASYLKDIGMDISKNFSYQELFRNMLETYETKKVLVIDEVQNMCKTDNEFFEELKMFFDSNEEKKDFFLVLCSSSISWVENTMESKMGDLTRLLSEIYKIRELSYQNFKEYFPRFSDTDRVGAYSILGGIPGLWKYFNDEYSLRENMEKFLLQNKEKLFDYGEQYVAEELRETAVYNTLLTALANGKEKLNDLYLYTGFSRAKISVYLKNLMQLELVEKVFSMDTEGRDQTQKGLYQIKHPYVFFYYRYLFPNRFRIQELSSVEFYEKFIEPTFLNFVSGGFKRICREFLEEESRAARLPDFFVYKGQWVGKKGNIDFIFENEDGEILSGICNWEKEILMPEDYQYFLECQKTAKIMSEYVILFSRGNFDKRLRDEVRKNPKLALVSITQMLI